MLQGFKKILGRRYQPLNRIDIDASCLRHNYHYLSSLNKKIKVAPVLKSNAYGHGLAVIAKQLQAIKPPFFCVDSLYEAYELLKINITTPILIMGYIDPKSLRTKKLPFSYAVYTYEQISAINKYQPHAKIHIFIDTGMHREGIHIDNLPEFLHYLKSDTKLTIEGLMSHLAMAEKHENPLTKMQIDKFQKARSILKEQNIKPKWVHIVNSSGLLNYKKYNEKLGNVARIGLALYGIDSNRKNKTLQPVLQLKTHIAQIKNLKKGEKVGYDFAFTASENMKIAILPIGYYDGVDRRLSNKGLVVIKGQECRILGRVSMNITTVDVSNVYNAKIGQEVIVYSEIRSDKNSVQNTATLCKTIPYDILVHLAASTKRFII